MTLTAILPSLRRSIPDPLQPRRWPEHTVPTVSDVVIGGVSLRRLVDITGTPALLTGDLPHPKPAQGPNPGWWTRGFDLGYESEFTRAPCLVGLW
jgi:hypothetical protein